MRVDDSSQKSSFPTTNASEPTFVGATICGLMPADYGQYGGVEFMAGDDASTGRQSENGHGHRRTGSSLIIDYYCHNGSRIDGKVVAWGIVPVITIDRFSIESSDLGLCRGNAVSNTAVLVGVCLDISVIDVADFYGRL
jgi:hypothetical protein